MKSSPTLEKLNEGVDIARKYKVGFILAIVVAASATTPRPWLLQTTMRVTIGIPSI